MTTLPPLITAKRVFVGTADLGCLGSRVLLASSVSGATAARVSQTLPRTSPAHNLSTGALSTLEVRNWTDASNKAVASFIIVNGKIPAEDTAGIALQITQLLEAAHPEEIVIIGSLHWPQLAHKTVYHQGTARTDVNLPKMPPLARLNDPLLASLYHFVTLRGLPASFFFTPGSKATIRAKSDGTAAEAQALAAALVPFGLIFNSAEFQLLEPGTLGDTSDVRSQFLMYN